jgi:hypothetical protein
VLLVSALWLDPIPSMLRAQACEALEAGDVLGFLCSAGNHDGLGLVYWNAQALRERHLYEVALLHAFTATRNNHARWPLRELRWLFHMADRNRLRAAGAPLPGPGPFTLYRGIAGRAPHRKPRGFSWTASPDQARWFAQWFDLGAPAVLRVTAPADWVLAVVTDRDEQEFLLWLPDHIRPRRLIETDAERQAGFERVQTEHRRELDRFLAEAGMPSAGQS